MNKLFVLAAVLTVLCCFGEVHAFSNINIIEVAPVRHASAAADTTVTIRWGAAMNLGNVDTSDVSIWSAQTGKFYTQTFTYTPEAGDSAMVINPGASFGAGEELYVSVNGIPQQGGGGFTKHFSYGFRCRPDTGYTGSFEKYLFAKSQAINSLAIGDLNNDGFNDFAMAESTESRAQAGFNLGMQNLTTATVSLPLTWSKGKLADMNRDGNLDFVGSSAGSLNIIYGDGTGSGYSGTRSYPYPTTHSIVDVNFSNYDAYPNLDVSVGYGSGIFILRNGFVSAETYQVTTTGSYGFHVSGDFDNDGLIDMVVLSTTNTSAMKLDFIKTSYDDWFNLLSFALRSTTLTQSTTFARLSTADINGDGNLDVLVSTYSAAEMPWLYYGTGTGSFTLASGSNVTTANAGLVPADVDGDGDMDLFVVEIAVSTSTASAFVQLNDGAGVFSDPVEIATVPPSYSELAAADMNADGRVDLVIASQVSSDSTIVLFNAPSGDIFVTNTNNSGPGSLRYALENATTGSVITFADGISPNFTITGAPIRIQSLLNLDFSNLGGITIEAVGGGPAILFSCDAAGSQLRNVTVIGSVVSDCSDMRPVYIRSTNPQ